MLDRHCVQQAETRGNSWKSERLGNLTTKIGSGATPLGGSRAYKHKGIALIRSQNVFDSGFVYDGLAFIDENQAGRLDHVEVSKDDVLLNITGAAVARCCVVPQDVLPARVNQHVMIIRAKRDCLNPRYLWYTLVSPKCKKLLLAFAQGGATREALTKEIVEGFRIHVPPIVVQQQIAAVIGAYDDLIENNHRRIQILEEMARAIYREWFVHLRFPGHEEVEMVDSEMGQTLEGWNETTVENAFEVTGGGTPSTKNPEFWEEGAINWYTPSDLTSSKSMFMDESGKKITELGLRKSSARMFPARSVMMTSRATIGFVSINTNPACTNQGFITCIPNERVSEYYIYFWLLDNVERFLSLGTGTTYKEIIKSVFRTIRFLLPPVGLVHEYTELVNPMCELILNLLRMNRNLTITRDLLLPKLVSGQLDVSELDIGTVDSNQETSKYEGQSTLDAWTDGDDQDADMG